MKLTAIEQMAVAKAIADKAAKQARENLAVGTSNVDFYIHVCGDLSISQDTEKVPTVSIPLYATLAIALQKAGIQAENILSIIESSVSEAIANDETVNESISERVRAICEHLKNRFAETLPKTPVKGAVRANLVVEKVEAVDLIIAKAA